LIKLRAAILRFRNQKPAVEAYGILQQQLALFKKLELMEKVLMARHSTLTVAILLL